MYAKAAAILKRRIVASKYKHTPTPKDGENALQAAYERVGNKHYQYINEYYFNNDEKQKL